MPQWFYSEENLTHGPCSEEGLAQLAADGLLQAHAQIWPEGGDRNHARPAEAVVDFKRLTTPKPLLPDWLEDVAKFQTKGPVPAPSQSHEIPDWLEDLQLWYGLKTPTVAQPAAPEHVRKSIEEWSDLEKLAAETARNETGFDPQTGQILDPMRFQKWKQQKAVVSAETASSTNASLMEVFRQARLAIERWVDNDDHRPFILERDVADVVTLPDVAGILHSFAGYGPVMKDKLHKHLAFMMQNRKEYYSAADRNAGR
jgi:GYF domain 2